MSKSDVIEAEWLKTEILPKILKSGRLVENYRADAENSFKIKDIKIKFIGSEEAFMLTICYRAKVEFEYDNVQTTLHFVVKKTPKISKEEYDGVNFEALFSNEICVYSSILPAMEKFSGEVLEHPKYYYSDKQPLFATIVMHDFTPNNWNMAKMSYNLSLDHVFVALKTLAKFHGTGFAWKKLQTTEFERETSVLQESRFAKDDIPVDWGLVLKTSMKRVSLATKKYQPECDTTFVDRLVAMLGDFIGYGRKRMQPIEPMVTLCHGDYLRNNIAFKYADEAIEQPIGAMMFDLQTMRVCSPMVDFAVFLALSAFKEVRHKHFDQIFSKYAEELANQYTKLTKTAVPDFLSKENLLKEYIQFMPYSISIAASFLMFLCSPPDETGIVPFGPNQAEETVIDFALHNGGELVDVELAHQVKELYDLTRQHNVDIFAGYENK